MPVRFNNRKAWFRVFYICGAVIPCWWDDNTHIYGTITHSEVSDAGLRPLISITRKIWEVCKLEFFSTEIAMTSEKKFVVVDYVNDICDMRLQLKHGDGVPDVVVNKVCKQIARHIKSLQL
jgi:hypothetical protein